MLFTMNSSSIVEKLKENILTHIYNYIEFVNVFRKIFQIVFFFYINKHFFCFIPLNFELSDIGMFGI